MKMNMWMIFLCINWFSSLMTPKKIGKNKVSCSQSARL